MESTAATSGIGSEPEHLSRAWLHDCVAELAAIERETATPGELEAAEWLIARLASLGATARIEEERLHNTYWWPLGIAGWKTRPEWAAS